MRSRPWHLPRTAAASLGALAVICSVLADDADKPRRVDPAAWGSDHVGKSTPAYVTGDECLFCHRDIGPTWPENRHQLTIRPALPEDPAIVALGNLAGAKQWAADTQYVLGARRLTRFLKRSTEYGKLDILGTAWSGHSREIKPAAAPGWDSKSFADRCAGCHTTAVQTESRAFASLSLDCFTCHGDVPLEHSKEPARALLSAQRQEPREVVSICGQCHLRGGKSRSTGLPYANTFVAGDNLFRDFQVDLSDSVIQAMPVAEQHIFLNARDVAVYDRRATNCLSCHDVHAQSVAKHVLLDEQPICASCHEPGSGGGKLRGEWRRRLAIRNRVCGY